MRTDTECIAGVIVGNSMKQSGNSRRIVKNTVFLYIRMLLLMLITLYTTRIVLRVLGEADFGIYNLIGGIVIMMAFFNGALSSTTNRYIAFELGKEQQGNAATAFASSVTIHVYFAILILLIAETFGLWFVNTRLNIPADRIGAMNFVYQFCTLSCILQVLQVPYYAAIIAHERMVFFSYLGILEAVLRLGVVFLLQIVAIDKLEGYAFLLFLVSAGIFTVYFVFCRLHFPAYRFRLVYDRAFLPQMISFSSWYLFGSLALMAMIQGGNVLLNIFFGALVNAAAAIAFQVNTAVTGFVNNFRMAVDPQIIKSCAADNITYMNHLVFGSARFTFYLLLLLTLPLLLEMEIILKLWLSKVPDYATLFTRLILIYTLVQSFDLSFGSVFRAAGRIKENQLMAGSAFLLVLPVSYLLFKWGFPPETLFIVQIAAGFAAAFFVKIFLLWKLQNISPGYYCRQLLFPTVTVACIAVILPLLIRFYMGAGIARLGTVAFFSVLSVAFSVYVFGIDRRTRVLIMAHLRSRFSM